MRVGEPGKVYNKRKVIHGDGAVFPKASDQDGDPEQQLVVAQQENHSLQDGPPESGSSIAHPKERESSEIVRHPAVNAIPVISSEQAQCVANESDG